MEHKPVLQYGATYHIYNRGINGSRLFNLDQDCEHFIHLIAAFTNGVADTYSFALMANHLHLAVRIKAAEEIGYLVPANKCSDDPAVKWRTVNTLLPDDQGHFNRPVPERMYGHLFNAYAKWYNCRYNRSGALFETRFERKLISSIRQLKRLLLYINQNPERHRVVKSLEEYQWTSYHALVGKEETWIARDKVLALFGGAPGFDHALSTNRP